MFYCNHIFFTFRLIINQLIRYGLVARICRSHQSSSLPSAGKARVRFPVSEYLVFCAVDGLTSDGRGVNN
jgi:hypothetical protein